MLGKTLRLPGTGVHGLKPKAAPLAFFKQCLLCFALLSVVSCKKCI